MLSTRRLDASALAELAESGIRCTAHDFVDIVPREHARKIQLQPGERTVLVSSQNALHALDWNGVQVRCVGEKTADKLRSRGAQVLSVHSGAASMSEHAVALGIRARSCGQHAHAHGGRPFARPELRLRWWRYMTPCMPLGGWTARGTESCFQPQRRSELPCVQRPAATVLLHWGDDGAVAQSLAIPSCWPPNPQAGGCARSH